MPGQLWQECYCGTEPVCADCEKCARHCSCERDKSDAKQIQEFEQQNPGFLEELHKHYEDGSREN